MTHASTAATAAPKTPYRAPRLGESPYASILADRMLHRFKAAGWQGLVDRVVSLARKAEARRGDRGAEAFLTDLGDAMRSGKMLPNSPLLVNCAEPDPRLFACFSVGVDRPHDEFLRSFRTIHDGMGGVGYAVSGREKDFATLIRLIDDDTCAHQHGRPRPASNAVTMPIGGDLDAFLALAGSLAVTNMNVALSDAFMASLSKDADARHQFDTIVARVHATGQPGILFADRIRPVARVPSAPYAANVCGEAPLSADESALLASVNLGAFVLTQPSGERCFDVDGFRRCVRLCVRFLDGMHEMQTHASEAMRANTLATRKVGVGVMGFAHAAMLLGMPYGSSACENFAGRLSQHLHDAAMEESSRLADVLGVFPAYEVASGVRRRNANLSAIAGTATIALLVHASPGIEPIFARLHAQRVIGREVQVLDPVVSFLLQERGFEPAQVAAQLAAGEHFRCIVGDALADLCPTALEIPGEAHIRIQAALQSAIDCGITKTINCPMETSVEDIGRWLMQAHAAGCMGLTVFRNSSLPHQPMSNGG